MALIRTIAFFALAVTITGAALLISIDSADTQPQTPFTEAWMVASRSAPSRVTVGLQSHEAKPSTYLVRVSTETQLVQEFANIKLKPGGRWEAMLQPPPGDLLAVVYHGSSASGVPYRRLHLSAATLTAHVI